MKTNMTPDENFELISHNAFTVNDTFVNSENDPDIKCLFYRF